MMGPHSTSDVQPAVSVIVPCRNEADMIGACVHSILNQELPCGQLELIVSDGGSTDGTRRVLETIAQADRRLRLIDNPGRFVSSGLNAGIKAARGEIIMRMDAHTVYASDYIHQCLSILQQTGADNVGGPALTESSGYVQRAIAAAYHSRFAVGGGRFHDPQFEGYVDTVPYGCWPRTVFSRIGLFDEELIRNQDDEFNLRLVRSGGKIWQSPRIKSWYHPRGSLVDLFQQYRQYGYWKIVVIRKHKIPASIRHIVPGGFVLTLLLLAAASLFWPSALWGLTGVGGVYLGVILLASTLTARTYGWRLLPILPLAFATYHVGYGVGSVQGVLDFLVRRRAPPNSLVSLTRRSASQ